MEEYEKWDTNITAERRFWTFNLKEILKYKYLVYLFVRRDFVANFKQTILGPIWFLVQPIATTLVFVIIFGGNTIIGNGVEPSLYFLSAIVAWGFFSEVFTKTSNTFMQNASIFGKVYFPRLVVPISLVFSGLLKFGVQFIVLLGVFCYYLYYGEYQDEISGEVRMLVPNWQYIALFPLNLLLLGLMAMSGGILASSLTSKYRDFTHLIGFGLQLVMYFTILFPSSSTFQAAAKYRLDHGLTLSETGYSWSEIISSLNPVSPIVETFRVGFAGTSSEYVYSEFYIYTIVFTAILAVVSIGVFNKTEQNFMDTV